MMSELTKLVIKLHLAKVWELLNWLATGFGRVLLASIGIASALIFVLAVFFAAAMLANPDDGTRFAARYQPIFDFFSSISTPLIAGMVAYIAWRQQRTDKTRLRVEVYEKRLKVYKAVMDFLRSVAREGEVQSEMMVMLAEAESESHFLFETDIPRYIDELWGKAGRFRSVERRMSRKRLAEKEWQKYTDESEELAAYFDKQLTQGARKKFQRYLALSDSAGGSA